MIRHFYQIGWSVGLRTVVYVFGIPEIYGALLDFLNGA